MRNKRYFSPSCLALVAMISLLPLPAMATDDKLYDSLLRFGAALDALQSQKFQEAEVQAGKLYDDAKRDGFDKPDASTRFPCPSGLDKVTPLIRFPKKYGNVYQRLFVEIRKLRAQARSALGKNAEAGAELQSIAEQYPEFADAKCALAMHYERTKQYDKALAELEKAERINPKLISIFYTRGLIFQEMGNREQEHKALLEFNKLRVSQEREIAEFIGGTSSGDAKLDEKRAEHLIEIHPTQSSPIAAYAEIISISRLQDSKKYATISIAVGPRLPFGYVSRADINLDLNQFKEAEDDASKAILIDPKNLDMRITRALAYLNTNRLADSLADLNFAIDHVPTWALPYSYRAAVYIAQGDYKKALVDSKTAVRIQPDDPLGYNNLGVCYSRLKMYPSAQQAFEKMVRLERNGSGFAGPLARFNLGRCYQVQNKDDLAKKQYDKTLISEPNFPEHMFKKSATATQSGFRDQELKTTLQTGKLPSIPFVLRDCIEDSSALFTRKLELVPRNNRCRYNRGLSHACLNQANDAANDLDQFVAKGKESTDRAILMAYLCHERAKQGDEAKKTLRANLSKISDKSLSSLAHFCLGDSSEAQVVKQTGSITGDTIVHCDLGYYYMTRGDRAKAKPHIEWALLHGDRQTMEYVLALTELERMCGRQ